MLGRFFPLNWRPPTDEIRFAAEHGFAAVQIRSDRAGGIADVLRAEPREVGEAFAAAGVEPVLEMLVFHGGEPETIPRALRETLPAIADLGVQRVHVHPVGPSEVAPRLPHELGTRSSSRSPGASPSASSTTPPATACWSGRRWSSTSSIRCPACISSGT